jgi:hypothetical protein
MAVNALSFEHGTYRSKGGSGRVGRLVAARREEKEKREKALHKITRQWMGIRDKR